MLEGNFVTSLNMNLDHAFSEECFVLSKFLRVLWLLSMFKLWIYSTFWTRIETRKMYKNYKPAKGRDSFFPFLTDFELF